MQGLIFVGAFAEPPRPFLLRLAPLAARSAALLRSAPAFLLRQYCLGQGASTAQLNLLRQALAEVSPDVLAHRLSIVAARHSFGNSLIDVPSCYIRATGDRLVPAQCADWFQKRIKACKVVEVDGPHFLLQMRPRESARAIADFMEKA